MRLGYISVGLWPTRTLHPFWGNFRVAGYSSEMPIPSTDFVVSNNRSNANQTTERLSMRTARLAAYLVRETIGDDMPT